VMLGGSAGARLSSRLGMPAARNTLLRLVRAAPLPPIRRPRCSGSTTGPIANATRTAPC
jgi:hypothetical protein